MVGTALLIVSNSNTRKPPSTINKTHRYKICPWRRNITTSHRQESSNWQWCPRASYLPAYLTATKFLTNSTKPPQTLRSRLETITSMPKINSSWCQPGHSGETSSCLYTPAPYPPSFPTWTVSVFANQGTTQLESNREGNAAGANRKRCSNREQEIFSQNLKTPLLFVFTNTHFTSASNILDKRWIY